MAGMQSAGYEVGRMTGRCAATGRELRPGERYVAALVEVPGQEELVREDYALDAWEGAAGAEPARPRAPRRLFGYWRGTVPEPNAAPRAFVDDEELLDLFAQLEGVEEPRRVAFRYLLALILIRKRLLTYEGGRPADLRHGTPGELIVKVRGQEGTVRVVDPGMDDATAAEATEELGRIMNLDEGEAGGGSGGGGAAGAPAKRGRSATSATRRAGSGRRR